MYQKFCPVHLNIFLLTSWDEILTKFTYKAVGHSLYFSAAGTFHYLQGKKIKGIRFAITNELSNQATHLRYEFLRFCIQNVGLKEGTDLHLLMVSNSLNFFHVYILHTFIGSLKYGLNFEKFSQVNQEMFLTLMVFGVESTSIKSSVHCIVIKSFFVFISSTRLQFWEQRLSYQVAYPNWCLVPWRLFRFCTDAVVIDVNMRLFNLITVSHMGCRFCFLIYKHQ